LIADYAASDLSSQESKSPDESEDDSVCSDEDLATMSPPHGHSLTDIQDSLPPGTSHSCRAKKGIINSRLSAALDKCKVSDRDAVHLLTAFVEGLSLNPSEYIINRTSIKNARERFRKQSAEKVKSDFSDKNVEFVVVHWDTKLLPDVSGQEKVDRLPVIVTAPGVEQLLGVPQLTSSSGGEISSAVFDSLEKWSLLEKV
jgi:hypothetical protein